MRSCSVIKELEVVPGRLDDYKALERFHYRESRLGAFEAIFRLRANKHLGNRAGIKTLGVIVYTLPSAGLELRKIATSNYFSGFDRATMLSLINKNIRCIGRVIIEPRFRGLGLASRLVRETMVKMDIPMIEALAVMGLVNPFLEKAGMKAYKAKMPVRCIELMEAFSLLGIEKGELIDAARVHEKLERLGHREAEFIDVEIRKFLRSYGNRREMAGGFERTRYVLSKLTSRPVYYVWMNKNLELRI